MATHRRRSEADDSTVRRFFGHHDAPEPELQPIRVYTAEAVFDGWMAFQDERLTDLLPQLEDLAVLPDGADRNDPRAWMRVESGQVLIVVPPPHVSPPERRAVRDKREVRLRVGAFRVVGTAHLRPGLEHDPYTRVTRPFLPLTGASVMREDGSEWTAYEVVIVNLRWAEFADA